MKVISPQQLHQELAAGRSCRLIDVRTPAEFASAHIARALLEPLERFSPARLLQANGGDLNPLYVICQSGGRARKAIQQLEGAGAANCVLVEGGMSAWAKAGFEVERDGEGTISLERQVRIVAGFLVLCGTLLGGFVHPALLVLPGFVGAGLMFAGISDICGMGMLLAKMPWNQTGNSAHGTSCCERSCS